MVNIKFQHTAARRRLDGMTTREIGHHWFQHTAARRRLDSRGSNKLLLICFNTQPPEGGWCDIINTLFFFLVVSTHSRPKAAGISHIISPCLSMFQHTAARRRLGRLYKALIPYIVFQHTAARRRLVYRILFPPAYQCFNTQPPEGGWLGWHAFNQVT